MNQHSKEGKLISPLLTLKTDRKLYKEVCNFFTVTFILKKKHHNTHKISETCTVTLFIISIIIVQPYSRFTDHIM